MIFDFLSMKWKVLTWFWGEKVYFFLPDSLKKIGEENLQEALEIGDIVFWPKNPAVCLFWGKTPILKGNKLIATEPVNDFAKIIDGMEILPKLEDENMIWMDKMEE